MQKVKNSIPEFQKKEKKRVLIFKKVYNYSATQNVKYFKLQIKINGTFETFYLETI